MTPALIFRLDFAAGTEKEKSAWIAALKEAQTFKIKPLLNLNADWDHLVCSGWVHTRGGWMSPTFQKKWMTLSAEGVLKYYETQADAASMREQGSLNCSGMLIREDAGRSMSGRLFCFVLTLESTMKHRHGSSSIQHMVLGCEQEKQRADWVSNLKIVRGSLQQIESHETGYQRDVHGFIADQYTAGAQVAFNINTVVVPTEEESAKRRMITVEAQQSKVDLELRKLQRISGSWWRKRWARFQSHLHAFEDSKQFSICITCTILLNIAVMAVECHKPNSTQVVFIDFSNIFFSFVFGSECVLRMLVHRPRKYFMSLWFCFDYFAAVMSFLVAGIELTRQDVGGVTVNPTLLRLFRLIKVIKTLRSLRLLKFLKGLNTILESLGTSLPIIGHTAILYCCTLFFFGIMGVVMLGKMCTENDRKLPGLRAMRCLLVSEEAILEEFSSFRSLEISFVTLIRLTTGDGWVNIMDRASTSYFARPEGNLALAAEALRRWNATEPTNIRVRREYLQQARDLLPGCALGPELNFLREQRLVDCSALSDPSFETVCSNTCGSVGALFFIPFYIFLTQGILLNLVVVVLIINLHTIGKKKGRGGKAHITKNVTYDKLERIYITWMAGSIRLRRDREVNQRHRLRVLARWLHQGLARVLDHWKEVMIKHSVLRRTLVRFLILGHPSLVAGIRSEEWHSPNPSSRIKATTGIA
jgi:hypothetical protein